MEKIFLFAATVMLLSGCGHSRERVYVVEPVVVEKPNGSDRVYVEDRGTERVYVKERPPHVVPE